MQTISKLNWWQHRRVAWPLAALAALTVILGIARVRANESSVVVCNETGARIAELTICACGQTQTFCDVADEDSVRMALRSGGGHGTVGVAINGTTLCRGDYIEPRGGYRTIVRLRRDGQAEFSTSISCWQTWFALPFAAAA